MPEVPHGLARAVLQRAGVACPRDCWFVCVFLLFVCFSLSSSPPLPSVIALLALFFISPLFQFLFPHNARRTREV